MPRRLRESAMDLSDGLPTHPLPKPRTVPKGLFTLSVSANVAMLLTISLGLNSLDFLILQSSHSNKMGCNPSWSNMMQALMLTLQTNHQHLV